MAEYLHKNRGADFRPRSTPFEANAKVAAYWAWKQNLPADQVEMLTGWEKSLSKKMKDMGEKSAAELMAEILLTERNLRNKYKGQDHDS